jgi:hypothetical protein
MIVSPLLDALDMIGTSEVIAIFGFLKPSALAVGLTGLSALGLGTVALVSHIAVVGKKEDIAVLTLTFSGGVSHGPESPQAYERGERGGREVDGEENGTRRRWKKEGLRANVGEEDGRT